MAKNSTAIVDLSLKVPRQCGHCSLLLIDAKLTEKGSYSDNRAYKLICDTRGARFVEGTPRSFHDCNISDVHWSPLSPENFRAEIEKVVAEYANETFQEKEKLDSFWDHIAVATTLSKSLKKKIKEFFFSLWEEYDKVVSIVKALSLGAP